ncbi:hypothetical protein N665_0030s0105 [Sinapis alba]|nr:hypothetical protein N665_0030s0105 [Sinapis alba]
MIGPSGNAGVRAWIQAGLPATQLVLGFPYYGYVWRLSNANTPSYYAATTGSAISPNGSIGYGQIRKFIVDNRAITVYNSTVVGNYCYAGMTWIGYDDNQSIVTKVRYAKQKGLHGYFSWHVGADDNSGLSRAASRAWDATVAKLKLEGDERMLTIVKKCILLKLTLQYLLCIRIYKYSNVIPV